MRDWIRRLATLLATTIFPIVLVEPFVHVNVETVAREHHWDNILTKLLGVLPDLNFLLDSMFFWFFFGASIGTAGALWVVKIIPDKRLPFPQKLDPPLLEFDESIEGCRLPSTLSPNNEATILFRAIIKNPNNQDVGVRAYLVGITKQDMAGNFVPCGYSENLLLAFAGEGPVGSGTLAWVRGHWADALNSRGFSTGYKRRIPGVCLCGGGGFDRVGDR